MVSCQTRRSLEQTAAGHYNTQFQANNLVGDVINYQIKQAVLVKTDNKGPKAFRESFSEANSTSSKTSQTSTENFSREKRSANYRDPLSSFDKETECAVDVCDCYRDPQTNRSHINCRYKNLYSVPVFTAVDTFYYEITFSANNYISRLHYNAFMNLKVERIDLLGNKLSSVEPGAFNGLTPYLHELLIEGNGVNGIEIPFPSMSILTKLRRLKVKNFRQDRLTEVNYIGYFTDLASLEFESVSLANIDRLAFKGKLSKLLQLDFQYVEFTQIPVESLSFLPSLTNLYIRFTNIDTIYSNSFEKLTNLKDLDLSFNQIDTVGSDAFLGVSIHLTHLDLGSNKLKPQSLTALSSKTWNNLRHLTLSYNDKLTYMPANVFRNMPNLEELFMVNTNLAQISRDLFTGLNNLLTLDLGWNIINSIQDGAFQHMNKLYELKLEYQFKSNSEAKPSPLEMSPGAFTGLGNNLVYLYLDGTKLIPEQFWNTLKIFKELQHLAISETTLNEIPYFAFSENKKLSQIELNKNNIKYFNQGTFKGLENTLREVSLNDNNLSTISDCVFKNFTRLDNIHLLRNPLDCDCRLKWLHTFILEKSQTVSTFLKNNFVCSEPKIYANQPLYKIPANDLICSSVFPERCVDHVYTTVTGNTADTPKTTTADKANFLKLTIASQTSSSITIAWSVSVKTSVQITGFKMVYKLTTFHGKGHVVNIHREEFIYTLHNLVHGSFYQICVTAEINGIENDSVKDCRTAQTYGESAGKDEHVDNKINAGDNRYVIIGAVIATIAVVTLIAVGICAVVKYKVQSIKELQLSFNSPVNRRQCIVGDDMKVSVMPNEYSEIDVARIANKYRVKCPKNMQRQFGVENYSYESGDELSPYQKIGRSRRKNPYENDEEEEPIQISTDGDEVHFKNELELRHSAPSRLDAGELKNQNDRNSRPLPQTPAEHDNQKKSSTLKPVKKGKTGKKQVLVTQASVYDNKKLTVKQNETFD